MNKNKKIIVRLIGGLGNQLFQLQYALKLQNEIGGYIELDDSSFQKSKQPHEKLAVAELNLPFPVKRLSWWDLWIQRRVEKLLFKLNISVLNLFKPVFHFESDKNKLANMERIIIEGFWQDTSNIHTPFINFLRMKLLTTGDVNDKTSNELICVHIRRGDYLTNKNKGVQQFLVVSLNYYENGFKYFKNKFTKPQFEIYTDDEGWALKEFGSRPYINIINTKMLSPIELLARMASYENYIIANSSLSWWAALLSKSSSKEVICPTNWTATTGSETYRLPSWIVAQN